MKIRQLVQVEIMGAYRTYTYAWEWDPHEGEKPLNVGDKVELPPNQVQEEGSSGTVVQLGSPYDGPVKPIVRIIKAAADMPPRVYGYDVVSVSEDEVAFRRPPEDDLWGGFGEGDYA